MRDELRGVLPVFFNGMPAIRSCCPSIEQRDRPSHRRSFFQIASIPTPVCDEVRTSKRLDGLALATSRGPLHGEVGPIETPSEISLMDYERFPSFDEPHRFNTNVYETLIEILSAARVYAVIFEVGLKTVLTLSRLIHVIVEQHSSLKASA